MNLHGFGLATWLGASQTRLNLFVLACVAAIGWIAGSAYERGNTARLVAAFAPVVRAGQRGA